ncbi:tRNA (adenosine(37)-N6)-dimethylallyltransferase MiaA, partial [bacterium]|nr:tRNA (adenosine(37)-N6)-dimethylallyltransferase MiaA [bacterium]
MASITILFIVGPTASGKSALAIDIAKQLNGEIICADSRTVYMGLDVSTAKPSTAEQDGVKHWGLDLVSPDQRFSAADFKAYAQGKIAEIQGRGKLPIIVGGTGLYIDGLLFDYQFGPAANEQLRAELEPLNIEQLQQRIIDAGIDMPQNVKNKRYLIRAIEQGGVNTQKSEPMPGALVVGLNPPKELLQKRIEVRANAMQQNGALQEAEWLFKTYGYEAPAASAPFFKAYAPHFAHGHNVLQGLSLLQGQTLQHVVAMRKVRSVGFK